MGVIEAPVTALAITETVLLAGVGSYIKFYDLPGRKLSHIKKVFQTSVVHGIKIFKNCGYSLVVIFGNKDLQIWTQTVPEGNVAVDFECNFNWRASDWIWDAILLYSDDDRKSYDLAAVALGHNVISLVDWKSGVKLKEIHCEEKCIIYSAHFINEPRPTWKTLTLCSGTVFNQVVIWRPSVVEDKSNVSKVLERIQAHDGVIFDVHYDLDCGFLLTASDDRSIRVWHCKGLNNPSTDSNCVKSHSDTKLISKLYGHESRVWKARFIKIDDEGFIISIGEDGYCIVWKMIKSGSEHGQYQYDWHIMRKMKSHKGRNVWSLSISGGYLATGGGDCGIRIWRLNELIENKVTVKKHPLPEQLQNIGVIKSVHMCNSNAVLAHTDNGVLLKFEVQNAAWNILRRSDNVKSYAIMCVCSDAYTVAIGNTKGVVTILILDRCWNNIRFMTSVKSELAYGKIHNLTWECNGAKTFLYVSGINGIFLLYCVDTIQFSVTEMELWHLPPAKHRWHMGALSVDVKHASYVVCGDRRGSLHLYKAGLEEPVHTIHGLHGKSGVTSITRIGDTIFSTGRDGIWRKLRVDSCNQAIKILKQNRAAQGMDWLESVASLNNDSNQISVLGFYGRNFIIWSSETGDTLFSVECGGGHRDWTFSSGNNTTAIAFLKESALHIARANRNVLVENSVLQPNFHAGQITSISHIASWIGEDGVEPLTVFATSGEDTKVYISLCRKILGRHQIEKLHLLDDHISNVRTLTSLMKEDSECYTKSFLFTGGGRASLNGYCVTVHKNACTRAQICDVDHRCSFSLNTDKKSRGVLKKDIDPEMRFMDIAAWREQDTILVASACSNGVLRIFWLDTDCETIQQLCQSHPMSNCLLTVHTLLVSSRRWIVTGGTDGFVRLWNIEADIGQKLVQKTALKHHMSGVNALHILPTPFSSQVSASMLVASGGDDNSVHISLLVYEDTLIRILRHCEVEKAHSTQITGLRLISPWNSDAMELITTSIDQRITRWTVSLADNNFNMSFNSSCLTSISDVSALEVWGSKNSLNYAICGQGIQVIAPF